MRTCARCRYEIDRDEYAFCPMCGSMLRSPLAPDGPPPPPPPDVDLDAPTSLDTPPVRLPGDPQPTEEITVVAMAAVPVETDVVPEIAWATVDDEAPTDPGLPMIAIRKVAAVEAPSATPRRPQQTPGAWLIPILLGTVLLLSALLVLRTREPAPLEPVANLVTIRPTAPVSESSPPQPATGESAAGGEMDFDARNLFDEDLDTYWSLPGTVSGESEFVTLLLSGPSELHQLHIVNGARPTEPPCTRNAKVQILRLGADDGSFQDITLPNSCDEYAIAITPMTTELVRLEVVSTYEGSSTLGAFLSVSEVWFDGRPNPDA